MRPEFFTNRYGLITDYLAEYMREMRKRSFSDAIDKFYKLGNNLNQARRYRGKAHSFRFTKTS
ncbi:ATP-dependent Lon protease|nr:ATP-dependent Lon protease [Candidatus Pantoea persica]